MRCRGVVVVSLLAACGGSRPPLGPGLTQSSAPPPSGGGPVNDKAGDGDGQVADAGASIAVAPTKDDASASPTNEDAGTNVAEAGASAPAGPPPSCAALARSGSPQSLVSFEWSQQIAPGPGSDVWDFVWIEASCTIRYQHMNEMRTATLRPEDCPSARAWVTNAGFLDVLRTGANCPYLDGNATETFEVLLSPEGRVARKTYKCNEPTVSAERACLNDLVKRSFPN